MARKTLRPVDWKYTVKFFVFLNLGLMINAVGITFFKTPNDFAFGGGPGISLILSSLFPQLNVGTAMYIINALFVVLGLIFLDIRKIGWTVYSSFALSFYVSLTETLFPMQQPLTDELFIEFCFAVILPAISSAIVFNIGASMGGTDIIAMILSKYSSIEIGKALLLSDLGIAVVAFFIYGAKTGLLCVLGVILRGVVVDGAIESINLRKVCTIVTSKSDEVKAFITEQLHKTATEQVAYGAYSHSEKTVLMSVLSRYETTRLRNFIMKTDPDAFMTIVNSSEIVGKGFRSI